MSDEQARARYRATMALLKPALERVVSDPDYRARLQQDPIAALAEVGIELTDSLRTELEGKRFSEFWEAQRSEVDGPVEVRDLPPQSDELAEQELEDIAGGLILGKGPVPSFAPPYVPVGPIAGTDVPKPDIGVELPDPDRDPLKRKP